MNGAPGVTRTPGTQFRKLLLYPPELRGREPDSTASRERSGFSGADERHGAADQLQEAGALQLALDLVAARADLTLRRAGRELAAGDVVERGAEEPAADVRRQLLPDGRVAEVLLAETAELLVEIVAVG